MKCISNNVVIGYLKFCLNKKVVVNYFLRLLDNKSNDFLSFICYMNHYLCNFSIDLFEVILTIQRLCLFNFGLGKKLLKQFSLVISEVEVSSQPPPPSSDVHSILSPTLYTLRDIPSYHTVDRNMSRWTVDFCWLDWLSPYQKIIFQTI